MLDAETQIKLDKVKDSSTHLEAPPLPERPYLGHERNTKKKIMAINKYIQSFEYNHTGTSYFALRRDRGIQHVTSTAKEIMREALPIQCVEAVFLAFLLTSEISNLERYPLSFKSNTAKTTYRHIVLALHDTKKNTWGCLGLSRRQTLQYKELKYHSLPLLIQEFIHSYQSCGHDLHTLYLGLPLPRDPHSTEPVNWRALRIALHQTSWSKSQVLLERYIKAAPYLSRIFANTGKMPTSYQKPRTTSPETDGDDTSLQSCEEKYLLTEVFDQVHKPPIPKIKQSRSRRRHSTKNQTRKHSNLEANTQAEEEQAEALANCLDSTFSSLSNDLDDDYHQECPPVTRDQGNIKQNDLINVVLPSSSNTDISNNECTTLPPKDDTEHNR